jgi:hypothetical protein
VDNPVIRKYFLRETIELRIYVKTSVVDNIGTGTRRLQNKFKLKNKTIFGQPKHVNIFTMVCLVEISLINTSF